MARNLLCGIRTLVHLTVSRWRRMIFFAPTSRWALRSESAFEHCCLKILEDWWLASEGIRTEVRD